MKKNIIRLTESQLNEVIKESVSSLLNESEQDGAFDYNVNADNMKAIFKKVYMKYKQINKLAEQCKIMLKNVDNAPMNEEMHYLYSDVLYAALKIKSITEEVPDLNGIINYIDYDKQFFLS